MVMNLDTRYSFSNSGWQLFARVNNVFDREYSNGGLLVEHRFYAATGALLAMKLHQNFLPQCPSYRLVWSAL